jgi:hypothetical protein
MSYPCIVYETAMWDTVFADNTPYSVSKRYTVTVIDPDPDSMIPDEIAMLPKCAYSRHFTADGLNHDVFNLYF